MEIKDLEQIKSFEEKYCDVLCSKEMGLWLRWRDDNIKEQIFSKYNIPKSEENAAEQVGIMILETEYNGKTLREWIEILPTRIMIRENLMFGFKACGWIILIKYLFRLFFGI